MTREPLPAFPGGFSVLMATYGGDDPELFRQALESVQHNTLAPDQFVLVVDGPTPAALAMIVAKLEAGGGVDVVRLPRNEGLAKALNAGLRRVHTKWTMRADADDINLPHRFEHLARVAAADPALDVIGSAIREFDRCGHAVAVRRPPSSHDAIIAQMPRRNPMNHMTVVYQTNRALAVGGYPQVHLKEDYALWCSMAKAGARFHNVHDILVHATAGREMYRRRGGLRYIRSEIDIQRHMVELRLKSVAAAVVHGVARSAVFALPGWARGIIYERLLRTQDEAT